MGRQLRVAIKRKPMACMTPENEDMMMNKGGILNEMQHYLSVTAVKRAFSLGSELFDAASPFLEKPTWWTAGKSILAMGKVMVEDVEVWANDYFDNDEWIEPYTSDFNQTLLPVLQRFPFERFKTVEENTFVRICTLPNGVRCGWVYDTRQANVNRIYVESSRLGDAQACIKQLLWEQFEGKSLVMRRNNHVASSNNEARVIIEVDNVFESKLSKRAVDYAEYLKKPLNEGVSRSVMFYGPPGTGKSTLARTIVELMGLRSFRIRVGDLGDPDTSALHHAINIFEPDAIILDDFDRANSQAQLLETLEFFQQKVKLVITTVNNRRLLDQALMRPGRIDELILVDRMDDEVVKHVLGQYSDGFEQVKDWPIAFISEYVKRRKYMSVTEASESIKELTLRVNEMAHYRDDDRDDDAARMLTLVKRTLKQRDNIDDSNDEEEDEEEDEENSPGGPFVGRGWK